MSANDDALRKVNNVRYWRHRIDLGNGIYSPGENRLKEFDKYGLTDELKGKSVIDIGAWDGYYSFEAEKLGAGPILATDVYSVLSDNNERWGGIRDGDEGIKTAKEILNSSVEIEDISIYDLPQDVKYDVVHFSAVLYHLRHPQLALDIIGNICKEFMIIETACVRPTGDLADELYSKTPLLCHRNKAGWFPNRLCAENMVKLAGFRKIEYREKRVEPVPNDRKFGKIVGNPPVKLDIYSDEETRVERFTDGKDVVLLSTDIGNMDLDNPDVKWLRVQNGISGHIQCWIPKEYFSEAPYVHKTFTGNENSLQLHRIHFLAYK